MVIVNTVIVTIDTGRRDTTESDFDESEENE